MYGTEAYLLNENFLQPIFRQEKGCWSYLADLIKLKLMWNIEKSENVRQKTCKIILLLGHPNKMWRYCQ